MIKIRDLTNEEAQKAMEQGEFSEAVTGSSENVAVILTQDWCPQWLSMEVWLDELEREGSDEHEIDVYLLIYNIKAYFNKFLDFKENELKNRLIPYVRYYTKGKLVADTNYVSKSEFLSHFH